MKQHARILLVEDNEINQEVGMELLRQAHFLVDLAQNGAEALDKIQSCRYDLVLMDVRMPVMDGLEACRLLRCMPLYEALPVVAMSANTLEADRLRCLAAGMSDFLAKPLEPGQLWRALRKWLPAQPAQTATHAPEICIEGIDSAPALRRMLGSTGLYFATLSKFCTLQENVVQQIRAALDHDDWETASRHAHTLKGVAASIGANRLVEESDALESMLSQQRPRAEAEAPLLALEVHMRTLVCAIRSTSWSAQLQQGAVAKSRQQVLVIDDSPEIQLIIIALLAEDYWVQTADNGARGLALAALEPLPDLILLDIVMPGLSGHEVCRRLKADPVTRPIPVIFLTSMKGDSDEEEGLALGAVDYIAKPISGAILRARVRTHVSLKLAYDQIREKNLALAVEVSHQSQELKFIQDVTIFAMASLAETRDNETGLHLHRTQTHIRALAEHLRTHPRFSAQLTQENIELIYKSAPLHDIGKVGIPDSILLKPGRLTAEEYAVMKTHAALGREAIEKAERQMGYSAPFLAFAKEITGSHQEKWDGSGYPEGLAGESIPVSARLMALADVYDALVSARPYKVALSHEQAAGIISAGRGKHFDPDIVDAFLALQEQFKESTLRFQDHCASKI